MRWVYLDLSDEGRAEGSLLYSWPSVQSGGLFGGIDYLTKQMPNNLVASLKNKTERDFGGNVSNLRHFSLLLSLLLFFLDVVRQFCWYCTYQSTGLQDPPPPHRL